MEAVARRGQTMAIDDALQCGGQGCLGLQQATAKQTQDSDGQYSSGLYHRQMSRFSAEMTG
jgi:hypothetical protein